MQVAGLLSSTGRTIPRQSDFVVSAAIPVSNTVVLRVRMHRSPSSCTTHRPPTMGYEQSSPRVRHTWPNNPTTANAVPHHLTRTGA